MRTNILMRGIRAGENDFTYGWINTVVISLLIFLGTANAVFMLAALGYAAYRIIVGDDEECIVLIIAIAPIATIFKMKAGSSSFYTYLILLYVLKNFFQRGTLDSYSVVFVIYFAIMQMMNRSFDTTTTIKMLANTCFLDIAYEKYSKNETKRLYYAFILGMVSCSVFKLLDSPLFKVSQFSNIKNLGKQFGDGNGTRFSGCYGDPNYYSVNLVIVICLIILLLNQKKIRKIPAISALALFVYCVYITYSKSAYVMMAFPLALYMYSQWRMGNSFKPLMTIIALLAIMAIILRIKPDLFDIFLARLKDDNSGGGINSLTTGRTEIWGYYLDYFVRHPFKTLFGSGMCDFSAVRGRAAHNTILEMIFHLGIIGSFLLMMSIKGVFSAYHVRHEYSFINRCIPIGIFIMYLFLSELFMSDPPIHLLLSFLSMDTPNPDVRKQRKTRNIDCERSKGG